ncbi:MAG: hypothetical protein KGI27_09990 [Thaumarchaeota archaeon]|nr:hypothetical protein [Nitrososphaerota archaeon]
MSEEKNLGGRPVGTGDDPNRISRQQVISDAKLYKQMAEDLKGWYKDHKESMTLDDRLKCLNFLRDTVIQQLKFHLAPAKAAAPTQDPEGAFDAEAVYKELIG